MAERNDPDYHRRNIILPDGYALRVLDWHGGQGTMAYSLGSTGMNDYVSPSMIDAGVADLEYILSRNKSRPKGQKGLSRKDLKDLKDLIGDLDGVARFSSEFTTEEHGLGDVDSGYADWLMEKEENPKTVSNRPDAFLWDAPAASGNVLVYAQQGQHSEASLDYYKERTVPAPLGDANVQALKRELEGLGYILRVVNRKPTTPSKPFQTRVTFRYPVELKENPKTVRGARQDILDDAYAQWNDIEKSDRRLKGLSQEVIDQLNGTWVEGVNNGYGAYLNVETDEGQDRLEAASDSEMHARDFSPFEFLAHDINNLDDIEEGLTSLGWELYEEGVRAGMNAGVALERLNRKAMKKGMSRTSRAPTRSRNPGAAKATNPKGRATEGEKSAKSAHARETLARMKIPVGEDFHALRSSQVDLLLAEAKRVKYKKPKNANGSKARYFHDRLQRQAQAKPKASSKQNPQPAAYDPQPGYRFQILCRNPSYDRAWEHCDYAVDSADKKHLLANYRQAYGAGYEFKTIALPKKYWPKSQQNPGELVNANTLDSESLRDLMDDAAAVGDAKVLKDIAEHSGKVASGNLTQREIEVDQALRWRSDAIAARLKGNIAKANELENKSAYAVHQVWMIDRRSGKKATSNPEVRKAKNRVLR